MNKFNQIESHPSTTLKAILLTLTLMILRGDSANYSVDEIYNDFPGNIDDENARLFFNCFESFINQSFKGEIDGQIIALNEYTTSQALSIKTIHYSAFPGMDIRISSGETTPQDIIEQFQSIGYNNISTVEFGFTNDDFSSKLVRFVLSDPNQEFCVQILEGTFVKNESGEYVIYEITITNEPLSITLKDDITNVLAGTSTFKTSAWLSQELQPNLTPAPELPLPLHELGSI